MSLRNKAGAIWNEHGGLILTVVGVVSGLAGTLLMMDRAPKAQKAIVEAENEKWQEYIERGGMENGEEYEPLTKKEKIKVAAPIVAPAIGLSLISSVCSVSAYIQLGNKIVQTTQALNQALTAKEVFEHAVEANVSRDKLEKIKKDAATQDVQNRMLAIPKDHKDDGLYSFIEPTSGQVFRGTCEIIRQGVLDFNEIMMSQDKGTLSDLMMCWMNKGAKGLVLSPSTDGWYWKADHEKDWLRVNTFSPISNDYGNPASYINYNREPKKI